MPNQPCNHYLKSAGCGVLLALVIAALSHSASAQQTQDRAAWMKDAKWGVMTHYLADWRARSDNETMSVEKWNELIDNFDVEGLADQLKSVGAGYHILTIGQNSGYYAAPNPTYDRLVGIQPSKCSRRDLILDMARALQKRDIKLIAYLPSGGPAGDRQARTALQWQNGPQPNREFQRMWERVIRDWSRRWGTNVVGWWFDGCYWPNAMYRSPKQPNFESFAAAARAGNRNSAVAFNPGVVPRLISMTPYEDYTAGEISDPTRMEVRRAMNGKLDGAQVQVLSYLGERWGMGAPRFTNVQVIAWSKYVRDQGGAITWDVPVQKNGRIADPFIDQLTEIGKAVAIKE